MQSIPLDAALNLLWAILALAATCGLAWKERGRRHRWHVCAVALACVCLFPVVSFSDDLIALAALSGSAPHRAGEGERRDDPGKGLSRALQALENFVVGNGLPAVAEFRFEGCAAPLVATASARPTPSASGRAPPLA